MAWRMIQKPGRNDFLNIITNHMNRVQDEFVDLKTTLDSYVDSCYLTSEEAERLLGKTKKIRDAKIKLLEDLYSEMKTL